MWTREELKTRAKACLKKYYWAAFAVSLIFGLVSGFGGGGGSSSNSGTNMNLGGNSGYISDGTGFFEEIGGELSGAAQEIPEIFNMLPGSGNGAGSSSMMMNRLFWSAFAGVVVVIVILSIILSVFVTPVMEVGKNRFYMESRLMGQSAGFGRLFWGFSNRYLNLVWTMFLRRLFIGIGFCLCVIPGIYLSYCYYLVPYILSENPDMKPMEAMRLSKEMMEGHKFNTFVLELSFIGWYLLGLLACGIGGLFVKPYEDATYAELYAVLRRPYSGRLGGFGMPDVVDSGSWNGTYVEPDRVYDAGNGYGANGNYGPDGAYGQNQEYPYGNGMNGGYGGSESYNTGWTQGGSQNPGMDPGADGKEERGSEVNRSEGGPGRGYYLNGVFYPYTDDEDK